MLLSLTTRSFIAGSLELAYSLIWGSHKIWGKAGDDTLDLLWSVGLFNRTVLVEI